MKSLFKSIILLNLLLSIQAREIIIISYENENSKTLKFIKNYFDNEPEVKTFVTYKKVSKPCKKRFDDVILHMCIDANDESYVIETDQEVLKKTMANFVIE